MKAAKRILETITTYGEDICNYAFNENERGNGGISRPRNDNKDRPRKKKARREIRNFING